MWVQIEIIAGKDKTIVIPFELGEEIGSSAFISFGKRLEWVKINYFEEENFEGNLFNNPTKIQISNKLRDSLLIPEGLIFQMKIAKNSIIIGPVIGLLLGGHNHRYDPKHMEKYSDRLEVYEKIGGLVYAFTPNTIDWEKLIAYGLYYNIEKKRWEYGSFPLPTAIYRRNFHTDTKIIRKLMNATGGKLFNSIRFDKYDLYKFIGNIDELASYLPPTELYTGYENIIEFIDKYNKIILKPVDLSRGRGICIVEKVDEQFKITDYRNKDTVQYPILDKQELSNFFSDDRNDFSNYIIQKYIKLARIQDSVYDIRVVMQKRKEKEWNCSGIECRMGGSNFLLTNISRGGSALTLTEALKRSFPIDCDYDELIKRVNELGLKICKALDTMGEHFAEFGIDIAIDEDKKLWIIEVNVFPSFKGFKVMDYETYMTIRHMPLLYAASLAGFE